MYLALLCRLAFAEGPASSKDVAPASPGAAAPTAVEAVAPVSSNAVAPASAEGASPSTEGAAPPVGEAAPQPEIKRGSLAKEVIDHGIKANISGVRYCYERRLAVDPTLAGRVTIKFVIGTDGAVTSATVKSSTVPDPAVGSCLCGRFMRMVFPPPDGDGIVIVSYPFEFTPG